MLYWVGVISVFCCLGFGMVVVVVVFGSVVRVGGWFVDWFLLVFVEFGVGVGLFGVGLVVVVWFAVVVWICFWMY